MPQDLPFWSALQRASALMACVLALSLAGCSEEQGETRQTDGEAEVTLPALETDRDPTPQSGTGGERQNVSPFGTTK